MDLLESIISIEERAIQRSAGIHRHSPSFIPLNLSGGIGDSILAIPTINFLRSAGFQVVVYSKHADVLGYFTDFPILKGSVPNFTWHLDLNTVARFEMSDQFSGFLIPEHEELFKRQNALFEVNRPLERLVKDHPIGKYVLTRYARTLDLRCNTFALHSLGFDPIKIESKKQERRIKQITIHDGYDLNSAHTVSDRSTKQWDIGHWNKLVQSLKKECPDYRIIQVGSKTSRPIQGVDECLINKTTITEAFSILSLSSLHIDGDSGLVHAAAEMGVPCVVMFGPTPSYFYGHPQNINISSPESCSGGCLSLKDSWMDKCPIGFDTPKCMDGITPEKVMEEIKKAPGFLVPRPQMASVPTLNY